MSNYNYNPKPPRVWSRVQNPCTFVNPEGPYFSTYDPLTKKTVSLAEADYDNKMINKGNVLQYKGNSARLTKSQKYSQLARLAGPNRTKVFATQSETYSNPNTTGLLRQNYSNYSFPNEIVGAPNNISGPFAYGITNPDDCSGNTIQDGGTLVCGTYANPCTGEIIKTSSTSATICSPSSASNVPGSSILCWNTKVQTWFPRQRYTMNNSTNKWPINYKFFRNASSLKPSSPPILFINFDDCELFLTWETPSSCFQILGYNIYINNEFYVNVSEFTNTYNLPLITGNLQIYITAVTTDSESDPSNTVSITIFFGIVLISNNNLSRQVLYESGYRTIVIEPSIIPLFGQNAISNGVIYNCGIDFPLNVLLIGGGGGGASGYNGECAGGGGGSAGINEIDNIIPPSNIPIEFTVGIGGGGRIPGNSGVGNSSGQAGQNTIVNFGSTQIISYGGKGGLGIGTTLEYGGGTGGDAVKISAPVGPNYSGYGGSGGGGAWNFGGGSSVNIGGSGGTGYTSNGNLGSNAVISSNIGGEGGDSVFPFINSIPLLGFVYFGGAGGGGGNLGGQAGADGSGGAGGSSSKDYTNDYGENAITYGAGGGGGGAINSISNYGGNGANGVIIIWWLTTPNSPILNITPGNASISATWTVPGINGGFPITGYNLYYGTSSSGPFNKINLGAGITNYNISPLNNGTTYFIYVAAKSADGEGAPSTIQNAYPGPPLAPYDLILNPQNNQITVNWTSPNTSPPLPSPNENLPITNYYVYYSTDNISFTSIDTSSSATSYIVSGLTNGITYYIKITAWNSIGEGSFSDTVNAYPGPPNAPTDLVLTSGNKNIYASWNSPNTSPPLPTPNQNLPIEYYIVSWFTGAILDGSANIIDTSYNIIGLTNGTQYTVSIKAVNANGQGSDVSGNATPIGPPDAPTSLTLTPGVKQIQATWTAPTSDGGSPITQYNISWYIGTTFVGSSDVSGNILTYTIGSLKDGTTYTVYVKAVNQAGFTGDVVSGNATTPTVPSAPTNLTLTSGSSIGSKSIKAEWKAPSSDGGQGGGGITSYIVNWYITGGSTTSIAISSNNLSYTIGDLTNGTSYNVYVQAVNDVGTGAASETKTQTPYGPPSAPTGLTLTSGNSQIKVDWTAPTDTGGSTIDYYIVSWYNGATFIGSDNTLDGQSPGTYTITGLTNGTTYTVNVQAHNTAGFTGAAASGTSTPASVPSAPTNLSVLPGTYRSIFVNWSPPTSDGGSAITYYTISWYEEGTIFAGSFNTPDASFLSLVITELYSETLYTVYVQAVNAIGAGEAASGSATTIQGQWQKIYTSPVPSQPQSIACSADGSQIYMGSASGSIYRANDYGGNWQALADGNLWASITCTPDGRYVYACNSNSTYYAGKIWASYYYGEDGAIVNSNSYNWSSIATADNGTSVVCCVYGRDIYESTNSGKDWSILYESFPANWSGVASGGYYNGFYIYYACMDGGGIYYTSSDTSGRLVKMDGAPYNTWKSIASVKYPYTNIAYAVARHGSVYRYGKDTNYIWTEVPNTYGYSWYDVACSYDGSRVYICEALGGTFNIFRSTDYGKTFNLFSNPPSGNWTSITTNSNGKVVYACDSNLYNQPGAVWRYI
jgi:hypothetical protein